MHFLQRILFSLVGYSLVFLGLNSRYDIIAENFINGSFSIDGGMIAYITLALLLAIINTIIKPLLMLLATPLRWLTLGLFTVIINAFLLWLLQLMSAFVPITMALHIEHWQTYVVVGIILSFVNGVIHWFEK